MNMMPSFGEITKDEIGVIGVIYRDYVATMLLWVAFCCCRLCSAAFRRRCQGVTASQGAGMKAMTLLRSLKFSLAATLRRSAVKQGKKQDFGFRAQGNFLWEG